MAGLHLRLLGTFEAGDEAGRAFDVNARKSRALLAAVALAPSHSLSRERLANLLWSDRGEAQARSSLRQALVGLRRDFAAANAPFLFASDFKVTIDPAHVAIDAIEFRHLAASDDIATLRRAAALYRGELLADNYIRDQAFEEWLASERRRHADIASNVLERLCANEVGPARIDLAKRLVALDPLREASHRILMQAYFDVGERGLALRQYELCRDMLGDELQIVPGEETEALRRRLMDQPVPLSKAKLNGDHVVPELAEAIDLGGIRPDERPLVAVLPFDAIGADAAVDSFCDGLTEDIITGLSRISAIRVVARNTMFTYKGRAVDIRGVGRDLGARYVLEGSVRTSAKRTRVSAQLIDGVSGHHIWAEQIDRANAEIFDLQNEITQSIVASAQTQLILNEGRSPVPGNEPERVSRLLARSWQRFLRLTNESLAECATLAERVLELDPRNAMAHRMLAIAIYHLVYMGFVAWTDLTVDRLFEHAKMSIEYEGADEYCHWAMGCAYLLKGQHELAAASLRRALEINPNCSLAFGSMGTVLAWGGKYDASVQSNELALRVNAQDPSNFFRHFGLSLAHYLASRYDEALPHARSVVQARPTWWLGQIIYAASISHIGGEDEARRIAGELTSSRREMPASLAALPFANANDREHLAGDLRKVGLLA